MDGKELTLCEEKRPELLQMLKAWHIVTTTWRRGKLVFKVGTGIVVWVAGLIAFIEKVGPHIKW